MSITTVNPYTQKALTEYQEQDIEEVRTEIVKLRQAQRDWTVSLDRRLEALKDVRSRLQANQRDLSILMSTEMGKVITQSEAEIKKCLWGIDYILENAPSMLAHEHIRTEAKKSYIRLDPLGVILLIMPWNFPAWQVFRAAVPALASGNAVMLKHASIVSGTSKKIEEIFSLDVFKSIITRGQTATAAVKFVDGISLTGSNDTGPLVAGEAGKWLKKYVLELGGSDPYIVLDSADLQDAIKNSAFARLQNNGQSCIASKRFIVHEKVYEDFYKGMKEAFSNITIGSPLDHATFLGPLSSAEQKQSVTKQVNQLRSLGTVDELASGLGGNFVPPTIVRTDALFTEEVFGPVAILKKFRTTKEAIQLANETPYGLGASIWGDIQEAEEMIPHIEAGLIAINKIVASDPRLPFGGVKNSGVGTELSRYGLVEFTSKRSVWIN